MAQPGRRLGDRALESTGCSETHERLAEQRSGAVLEEAELVQREELETEAERLAEQPGGAVLEEAELDFTVRIDCHGLPWRPFHKALPPDPG